MKIKDLIKRQQEIVAGAKAENRALTEAEQSEFDDCQRQIDAAQENAEGDTTTPEQARADENMRVMEITKLCRKFGVGEEEERAMLTDTSVTINEANKRVLSILEKQTKPLQVKVISDENDKYREMAAEGLALRAGAPIEKPADGARKMSGMSLRDLAVDCFTRDGMETASLLRMSTDDIFALAQREYLNPAASFPAIIDTAVKKSVVEMYKAVPTTYQEFCSIGSVKDFKETPDHEYVMGGGAFNKVSEGGELKASTLKTELLPKRKIDTYGTQFSMTRQAFIDDDIGFIAKVPGKYATAAKREINKQVYQLMYNNPTIFDGKTFFHADHKNLISSGAAPSAATVMAAINKLAVQTDQFGNNINNVPKAIVVPVGYGFEISKIFASQQMPGTNNNDANPLYGYKIAIVEDATLNALAGSNACPWFIVADPNCSKSVQVDFLNGNQTPIIRRMEKAGQLGYTWDIFLDWGVAAVDFRGIVKNLGAVVTI